MTVQSTVAETRLKTSAWLPSSMFRKRVVISSRVGYDEDMVDVIADVCRRSMEVLVVEALQVYIGVLG